MDPVDFGGVEVDRCRACGGLWFDLLEQHDLKAVEGSESIDIGDPARGQLHDEESPVYCPREGALMIRMVDLDQPHIWIEGCPVCHGAFFDAGEFTDFKQHTLLEKAAPRRRPREP
jgi:Zn-finger nucleic acid-binding protein